MNEVFKQYQKFVNSITSEDSLNDEKFTERTIKLREAGLSFAKMDTACSGIAGEAGEINDLWKKIKFHGKPWNDENKQKMVSEVGDLFWYLSHMLEILDVSVEEVLDRNMDKLQERYPESKFSTDRSENRHTSVHGAPKQTPETRMVDNAVQEHLDRLGHKPEEKLRPRGPSEAKAEFAPALPIEEADIKYKQDPQPNGPTPFKDKKSWLGRIFN